METAMNLYLVEVSEELRKTYCREDYNYHFVSFVVACRNEKEARNSHPGEYDSDTLGEWGDNTWINKKYIDQLDVTHIGIAVPELKGVIISSSFGD